MNYPRIYLIAQTDKKLVVSIKAYGDKKLLLFCPLYEECDVIESILITISKGENKDSYRMIMKSFYVFGTLFYFNDVLIDYTNITLVGIKDGDYIFIDTEQWGKSHEQNRPKALPI